MAFHQLFMKPNSQRQLIINILLLMSGIYLALIPAKQVQATVWSGFAAGIIATEKQIDVRTNRLATGALALIQHSLTVTKVGNGVGRIASAPIGIDCGADCVAFYEQGTLVTLTASAELGSTFVGWQGACTGAGVVCTVTLNALTEVTAVFALNQYQLTTAKAGNGIGKVTSSPSGIDCGNDCTEFYAHGALVTVTASADPSSTFAGWIGACSGVNPTCAITMDAAKSVTAIFILNQYAISLTKSGNGSGNVVSAPSGLDCGSACTANYPHGTILMLTATAANGSTFTGWQGACTGTGITCTVTIDSAKAVTALFVLNQYNLTVEKTGNGSGGVVSTPGGIDCGNICTAAYTYGSSVNLRATAAPNATFVGWSGACTGTTPTCTMTVDKATDVTATFALKQYSLVVNQQGNGLGAVIGQPGNINCGTTCTSLYDHGTAVMLTATAEATSLFTGWQGACTTTTATCVVTVDNAKAVTATFALKQYPLTLYHQGNGAGLITGQPGGIACRSNCTRQIDHGTTITLTATATVSSTFSGWQGACTGNALNCLVTIDTAKNVTATFTLKRYPLTVVKGGDGDGRITSLPPGLACGFTCTQTVDHGALVTLTATAAVSSTFGGWQGACTGLSPICAVTVKAAQQVTATFNLNQYTLTVHPTGTGSGIVSSSPDGLRCGPTCTMPLAHGTLVTLTATAPISSTFSGWQGACTGGNTICVVTLDADKTVTATFTLKQYELRVQSVGTGAGVVTGLPLAPDCGRSCTWLVDHGARISITATAAISSTFTGWQGACTGVEPRCVFTMDGAKQITASFTLNAYALRVSKTGNGSGTVTSSPAGLACGLTCDLNAPYGTLITVTATPDPSSVFTGWQGACEGSGPVCTLPLFTAKTITATFSLQRYPLAVTKQGTGMGTVSSLPAAIACGVTCTASVEHGTVVTLTATAAVHASFGGWTGACTGLDVCVLTMDAAKAVTATFTSEPILSLTATITTTPAVATAGQMITYTYWITNTGDLSVTVTAQRMNAGALLLTDPVTQTPLSSTMYLPPGGSAVAVRATIAPRCDTETPWGDTLIVTGTTSSGLVATTQVSITTPLTSGVLPPQVATADTIYIGCVIQMALGTSAATQPQQYDMVVIVGPAPEGLIVYGAQSIQPYRNLFTLLEQTNALLHEGCPTEEGCRTVRRLRIDQGNVIGVETFTGSIAANQLFIPFVRR